MANSSFKKNTRTTPIPFTVPNGGTGRTSLTSGGILVGSGSGDVNIILPGSAGEAIVSDGYSFRSGGITPPDSSITSAKIGSDLSNSSDIASVNIDWSSSSIFTKTLTSNTNFTFSNYQLNKFITLVISGNYYVSLPKNVRSIIGVYNGLTTNYITLHCTKVTTPEEVWAVINNKYIDNHLYLGYFGGGYTSGAVATTDRIVFSTGIISANTVSNLSAVRWGIAGVSDAINYGYFAAGSPAVSSYVATTDRIIFSSGVTAVNTVSNLSLARYAIASVSDGSTYGYFGGGVSDNPVATAERIVFSSGVTSANTVSNLSGVKYSMSGISDASLYGYIFGGWNMVTTDRIVFSTGATSASTVSNLSVARSYTTGVSDSETYGYFAGGNTDNTTTVDRIVFSTSVNSANTVSNLSVARARSSAASWKKQVGYFAGGTVASSLVSTSEMLNFSTGVSGASTASNLSQARNQLAGLSDNSV